MMTAIALLIGFGALTAIAVMAFFGNYWFEYWGGDE